MPELPEVETLRRDIERNFVGRVVSGFEVFGGRTVRRNELLIGAFYELMAGSELERATRYGKFLVLHMRPLNHANECGEKEFKLVIHLGMSGRFILGSPSESQVRDHTKALFGFGDDVLRFWDPRTFGEIFFDNGVDSLGRPQSLIDRLGVDPYLFPDEVAESLEKLGRKSRRGIKNILLDQRIVCGLGNIYSDEVLFEAGLSPQRSGNSLSEGEVDRLAKAIAHVIGDAVGMRGSSLKDMSYLDLTGRPGEFQYYHKVYGRFSESCFKCHGKIGRVKMGGRSACYCVRCQN